MTERRDRRAAMVAAMADHVLVHGVVASSLRPLARAAGISDRMLLYHFPDKATVMAAVLDHLAAQLAGALVAHGAGTPLPLDALVRRLAPVLLGNEVWPFMRLWLEIAALAARDDAYRAIGGGIARGFLTWGAGQLDSATPGERAIDAARLLVTIEGMVLLKAVGLDDEAMRALRDATPPAPGTDRPPPPTG